MLTPKEDPNPFYRKGCNSSFNAVHRDNPGIASKMYRKSPFEGPMLNPNMDCVKRKVSASYRMTSPKEWHKARQADARKFLCMTDEGVCSLHLRQDLSKMKRESSQDSMLPSIKQSQPTSRKGSIMEVPEPEATFTDTVSDKKLRKKKEKRQTYHERRKFGREVPNFSVGAKKVNCFEKNPFPGQEGFFNGSAHERRFDLPDLDFEVRSVYRNSKNGPELKNYAKRKLHWKEESDLPDQNYYSHLEQ